MEFHFRKGIFILVIRRFISEERMLSKFKVARPGFSITIPTLFEQELQIFLKRNRKSSYTYL